MSKYGLHGSLRAQKGQTRQLADILCEAADMMANARGCQLYLVSLDPDNDQLVWVSEVWDSQTDHDEALKDAAVRQLIARAIPILDGQPQKGQTLKVIGGI